MINDINTWRVGVVDECPGTPLDTVFPISKRAACFIARNKANALLKTHFLNAQGAVEMMKGLDYHHDNFMNVINCLAQIGMQDGANDLQCVLLHEAVAYLNRLGQFYYFLKSSFVKEHCSNTESLAPSILKHVIFRHKSVHRSIDKPDTFRPESEHVRATQAMSLSAIGAKIFEPKPGQVSHFSRVKTTDVETFFRDLWGNNYLIFQLITDEPEVFHNFSIEKEHAKIMHEAYAILERVLK